VLGRLSLRVGTNFTSGGLAWQPFFTASVFHEFAGDVTARSIVQGTITPATPVSNIEGLVLTSRSTGGVGTYGQFALGTAAAVLNTGWLGYARVDYRVGDDIDGWGVNAGLRYQFSPDQRAGSIKDAPIVADTYNWTGFYLGGAAGVLWGDEAWRPTNAAGVPTGTVGVDPHFMGYLLGGQLGYNHQFGNVVLGVEADYAGSNGEGGKSCPNANFFTCNAEIDDLASVMGKVGYAWGRTLFYAKLGWASAEMTGAVSQNTPNPNIGVPLATPVVVSKRLDGVAYGAGIEFALTDRWSARADWTHFDFGKENFQVTNVPEFADVSAGGNAVRLGVNWHLNPIRQEARPIK
jgi:opacity protein-like surface antigen